MLEGVQYAIKTKKANKKNKVPLTLNPSGYPMDKVHIDFVGPLKKTSQGNEHIMVVICAFSKWVELFFPPAITIGRTHSSGFGKRCFCQTGLPHENYHRPGQEL